MIAEAPAALSLRLDKWLWFARFVKSRALASKLVEAGGFRVNGQPTAKAHYAVKPGDTLTFPLGRHIRVIKILALGVRRGPAVEAQSLYEDLDPPQPTVRQIDPATASQGLRDTGSGRPTKRERRATDRLLDDS
jgi:ribosome-associated heat shock protein Hsp15